MRSCVVFAALVLMSAVASAADPADTPESRREAAGRYAKVADIRKLLADTVESIAQTLPEAQRSAFRTLLTKHVRVEVVEAAMLASMQKNFTTAELNALADFYGSEAGRSAMTKLGPYMADVMPIIEAEMKRAAAELERESAARRSSSGT